MFSFPDHNEDLRQTKPASTTNVGFRRPLVVSDVTEGIMSIHH